MKESHYNMYMKTWTQLWSTIMQQQASRQKRNLKVDLGKYGQMYRAPFLYLPGAPNSLNLPLGGSMRSIYFIWQSQLFLDPFRSQKQFCF